MDVDPVCHMEVDPDSAKYKSTFKGRTWAFCTESCKKKFDENPEQYATMTQPIGEDRPGM